MVKRQNETVCNLYRLLVNIYIGPNVDSFIYKWTNLIIYSNILEYPICIATGGVSTRVSV